MSFSKVFAIIIVHTKDLKTLVNGGNLRHQLLMRCNFQERTKASKSPNWKTPYFTLGLGMVNFSSGEVGIFDSIPELSSSFWAEPDNGIATSNINGMEQGQMEKRTLLEHDLMDILTTNSSV
ncbi:hypothetical protein BDZ94DRAFT_1301130 [Collybia nuda]|uniref:Uncharacterized protein n=1 Tax=Collybia nuda TaxID=64659 RepID=A0A9P5XXS6_9AGAR|nr:hypothetical protein BDZ94DRAFT_1301130 [Collybia nuda]